MIFPLDFMGIQKQFFIPGFGIIKNGHLSIAYNHQFLGGYAFSPYS